MENEHNMGEHGSREWGSINPMQNDKVSMFGTPQNPQSYRGMRPSLLELIRMEPRRQH
jgi:hypothetical protein